MKNNTYLKIILAIISIAIAVFAVSYFEKNNTETKNKAKHETVTTTMATTTTPATPKNQKKINKIANDMEEELNGEIKKENKDSSNKKKTHSEVEVGDSKELNNEDGWSPMVTVH